jgi:hypothetical protein
MAYDFGCILSSEEEKKRFCSWFWSEDENGNGLINEDENGNGLINENGNSLINALNSNNYESPGSKIRRRCQWWPHIYCIVFNNNATPGKGAKGDEWKYCKVGITEVDTTPGTHNRMETVKDEIDHRTGSKPGAASIIFVLPVKATDPKPNKVIEKSIREHVGWPVDKELARECNFPVPTEWVITTQLFIDEIREEIKKIQKANEEKEAAKEAKEEIDTGLFDGKKLIWTQQDENLPKNLKKRKDGKITSKDGKITSEDGKITSKDGKITSKDGKPEK